MDSNLKNNVKIEIKKHKKMRFITMLYDFGHIIGISVFMLSWYILNEYPPFLKILFSVLIAYTFIACAFFYYKFGILVTDSEAEFAYQSFIYGGANSNVLATNQEASTRKKR